MEPKNELTTNDGYSNNVASFLSSPSSSTPELNKSRKTVNHIRFSNNRWHDENDLNECASEPEYDDGDNDECLINTNATDITRCICEMTHDDGFMICCDRCL
jgi:hypothetical protein